MHTKTGLLLIEHLLLHKITKSSLQIRFPVLNVCTYKYTHAHMYRYVYISPPPPHALFCFKTAIVLKSQSCPDLKETLKMIHTYRNNQVQPCFMLQKKAQHMRDGLKYWLAAHRIPPFQSAHRVTWQHLADGQA